MPSFPKYRTQLANGVDVVIQPLNSPLFLEAAKALCIRNLAPATEDLPVLDEILKQSLDRIWSPFTILLAFEDKEPRLRKLFDFPFKPEDAIGAICIRAHDGKGERASSSTSYQLEDLCADGKFRGNGLGTHLVLAAKETIGRRSHNNGVKSPARVSLTGLTDDMCHRLYRPAGFDFVPGGGPRDMLCYVSPATGSSQPKP